MIDRQVLEGKSVVQNEPVVQSAVKLAAEHYKSQLDLSPGAGNRYIALNNKVRAVLERRPAQGRVRGRRSRGARPRARR